MSANCGDYRERRGVGICNEFPIAFMPHILWLCASGIQAEHPQGLEMNKSDIGDWARALGRAAILMPSAARLGPFTLLVLLQVLIPPARCCHHPRPFSPRLQLYDEVDYRQLLIGRS